VTIRKTIDDWAAGIAKRLLDWITQHVESPQREWIEAVQAELDVIDGGFAQLAWAVGGVRIIFVRMATHNVPTRLSLPLERRPTGHGMIFVLVLLLSLLLLASAVPTIATSPPTGCGPAAQFVCGK
jgi:hypothetical protein